MVGIVNKVYYASELQNKSNSFQYIWRGLDGDLYSWGLKSNVFFLFTGRWAYNWGGLITGVLISGGLQYAFGHVSKDLSVLHKLYVKVS